MRASMKSRFYRTGIIPVIKLDDANSAVPLANALLKGGIDVIEITFRTGAATEAIALIRQQCPDMMVGAGTVITLDNLARAVAAGAAFIVAPGLNPKIVSAAKKAGVFMLPGVVTPSEIEQGLSLGLDTFKFFPAGEFGGIKTIEALSAPYGNIRFVPTGGVNADNAEVYLINKAVLAVGGTWVAPSNCIAEGLYDEITALATEARRLCDSVRGNNN
ncbi:MAG: hypothetical protein A2029_05850 [Chloroflexi bacterium RBG_19FT_COMBO_47_9]|nr:MAG: hypothetical protein A2Y53_06095 [Chloroflexi bacterium RBG_16_47_49]OGO59988.1 MAG: hypothetical protein A2029_05850 [Chloroflexi bacterium RBG_19FT_COMBO_47_9]